MAVPDNIDWYGIETINSRTQTESPYSEKKLPCKGRACAKCGKCRDWYWALFSDFAGIRRDYMKRADATCTGCFGGAYDSQYDDETCCGGGSYWHCFLSWWCFGRHCECDDNRLTF